MQHAAEIKTRFTIFVVRKWNLWPRKALAVPEAARATSNSSTRDTKVGARAGLAPKHLYALVPLNVHATDKDAAFLLLHA